MSLSSDQQTALEAASVRAVYFCEFRFLSETIYACTSNQTIAWDGHDWLGLGAVTAIGSVQESDSLDARPLDFSLNAAKLEWVAIAIGSVEEYRGRVVRMYMCPLNDQNQLIGEPELCWAGIMQTLTTNIDGDQGKISLRCESSVYGLKRRQALRMNDAQQRARHPTDTGFAYVNDLLANPQTWLSRRFQQV